MSDIDLTEAIDAIQASEEVDAAWTDEDFYAMAQAAAKVALPLIAAQVRAQVAAEAASLLAAHQMAGRGMSWNSADQCSCGATTRPEPGDEDVSIRRYRAFAAHQADVLARGDAS